MNPGNLRIYEGLCPNCFSSGFSGVCSRCGYEQGKNNNLVLPAGLVLNNRYVIGRLLGQGGFGATYKAYDNEMSDTVAIKEYFPRDWSKRNPEDCRIVPINQECIPRYAHGLDGFVNEARILSGLISEKGVVEVKDFFKENNTGYIVMEYIATGTISRYMVKNKAVFSAADATRIVREVAETLAVIHKTGLLHRDISPDNIMLDPSTLGSEYIKVKLIDFGATRQYVMNEPTSVSVFVKPGFAPPEQYSRSDYQGPWTDIYALCATYYYMLCGQKPPQTVDRSPVDTMEPLSSVRKDIDPAISDIITDGMRLEYKVRIHDMNELIKRIDSTGLLTEGRRGYTDRSVSKRNGPGGIAAAGTGSGMMPHITVYTGNTVKKYKFPAQYSVSIGRRDDNDIVIGQSEVSRQHCRISFDVRKHMFQITDLSSNGTLYNGNVIGRGKTVEVTPGSDIFLASSANRLLLEVR